MFFSAVQLAGVAGMPASERGVQIMAQREGWTHRKRTGRGGGREYPLDVLPAETQAALITVSSATAQAVVAHCPSANEATEGISYDVEALQQHYARASQATKDEAARKQRAVLAVAQLHGQGLQLREAIRNTALATDIAEGTLRSWWYRVAEKPSEHWLLFLLDGYVGRVATAECSVEAWEWYRGHYLQRRGPTHASSYRRLQELAKAKGWIIPSPKTLERRMDAEVSVFTQKFMREGAEALSKLFPAQIRDKTCFAAGQAANGDGLKFDKLWIRFPDGEVICTTTVWFWQDIRTGKILARRAGKTENTDLFRLSVWDLTAICLPEHVWVDNTRVAANKAMTGGTTGRHRFHAKSDDLTGALIQLGMTPHFTDPSEEANKGSKPIERAFGIGGLHSEVATHPRFSNRGYNQATAIAFEEFMQVLDEEIVRFNAREGRRSLVCGGQLSFDQAWEQSIAQIVPRRATDAQRRVLLLMPEAVTASSRDGAVTIQAGRGPAGANRYWCEQLAEYRGQKLVVYYDPDNLSLDAHIYTLDGRYLFAAQHLATVAFNDTVSGREWGKNKQRLLKARKHAARAETRMDELERAALYAQATPTAPAPAAPAGKVVQGHFKQTTNPQRDAMPRAVGAEDFNSRFSERVQQLLKTREEKV